MFVDNLAILYEYTLYFYLLRVLYTIKSSLVQGGSRPPWRFNKGIFECEYVVIACYT